MRKFRESYKGQGNLLIYLALKIDIVFCYDHCSYILALSEAVK